MATPDVTDRQSDEFRFSWAGHEGTVIVQCVPNLAPDAYGCWNRVAAGLPVCTARVAYPEVGYRAMFGWVQLVRSTDNESHGEQFEPDPFALFGDAQSPYAWYGIEPTLFDAPSREAVVPDEWIAHSWLATTPIDDLLAGNPRSVVPVLGFSWGFQILPDDRIELRPIEELQSDEWRTDAQVLAQTYPPPRWTFAVGAM